MDLYMKRLFESIAKNDMKHSREYAKGILESNNKKCDEAIKKDLLPMLSTNIIELPATVRGLIEAENVEEYFKFNRYITTKEDEEVAKKVIDTWNVRTQLLQYNIKHLNSLLLHGEPGCGNE